MHRHGYQGRKFGRHKDQRQALVAGLASALVIAESIETTLPKAKETLRYTEKLITRAKTGSLHSRRQVISQLSVAAGNKLIDEITPKLGGRTSGYLTIEKTTIRRGDNAQLARLSFVDDVKAKPAKTEKVVKNTPSTTKTANKPAKSREVSSENL